MKQELDTETNKSIESHLATLKTKFNEILQKQNSECEKLEAETESHHKIKTTELKLLQEEVGMIERDITTVNTMLSETEKTAKNFKFEKNLKDKRAIISGRFEEIEKSYH